MRDVARLKKMMTRLADQITNCVIAHHHHHHNLSSMELGHLLTRSDLTHRNTSSVLFTGSFCLFMFSVSLLWIICYEAFCFISVEGNPYLQHNRKLKKCTSCKMTVVILRFFIQTRFHSLTTTNLYLKKNIGFTTYNRASYVPLN
jgi:hypothetical protein